jgi:hypothetical protein
MANKRIRLNDDEVAYLKIPKRNETKQYRLTDNQKTALYIYRGHDAGLVEEAIKNGINPENVNHYWYKGKSYSIHAKQDTDENALSLENIESTIQTILDAYTNITPTTFKPKKVKENKAIKVTITDSHVGMNVNPNKDALFQYEYNANIYQDSMDKVFTSIIKEYNTHGTFDVLYLDDLGDLADGWNGYTTRGGHELPQNLNNAEVFDVCVDARVKLIQKIVKSKAANKIILRCICNDNHSGDFGLIINKTIQKIINLLYDNNIVEVDILTRFLEHRVYGKHCFILTHGKDKKQMNRGLPIILNDKAVRLISDYIDHYDINSDFIHVEKGDLHQIGYQKVKQFDYRNFMSFAPPSSWIQHNFGDSYSGYSIQVIPKDTNEISHTDYFLNYKKALKK